MDIAKAKITGPCTITFNGVNLGHTLDGITFAAERSFADVKVDKYGDTPIDQILVGTKVTVKFKLAQTGFPQLDVSMPETSSYDGAGTLDRVDLGGDTGFSLRTQAFPLVIHPIKNTGDVSEDITIYKAVSVENIEIPYKIDEQQVVEITMLGLVDESYGVGRRIGHIGAANVS